MRHQFECVHCGNFTGKVIGGFPQCDPCIASPAKRPAQEPMEAYADPESLNGSWGHLALLLWWD